jgi:hypothetical protein
MLAAARPNRLREHAVKNYAYWFKYHPCNGFTFARWCVMTSAEICLALTYHFQPTRNLMLFEMPINAKPIERRSSRSFQYPLDNAFGPPAPMIWNEHVDYLADLLVITPNDYATEVEIKVSKSDWKNDAQKRKWSAGLPDWICRFIYVVPEKLGIPDWVTPKCGVLHATEGRNGISLKVARGPGRFGFVKVPAKTKAYLLNCAYQRYWQQRIGHLTEAVNNAAERDRKKKAEAAQLRGIEILPNARSLRVA